MDNSTVDSMCRCCAAEGIFKDIKTSYHWMGEEEVYGDMLRECFDVKLATIEEGGICEVCITQLRNAVNFKKQVLHTEKKFKRHLENRRFKPAEVKEELSGDNVNSSDDNDNGGADSEDDEDYVPEFEIPIKTESLEEAKSRKRSAKATTSRAKKSKHDDGDKSDDEEDKKEIEECKPDFGKPNPDELRKQRHNLKHLLLSTNATPIRRHTDMGYVCSFCAKCYQKPADLKKHTLGTHDSNTKATFMNKTCLSRFLIKLDVTDLECTVCGDRIASFAEVIDHLQEHGIFLYSDITNYIIPFIFKDSLLKCTFCFEVHRKFKSLQIHMYEHYKNLVCSVCGAGFVTQQMVSTHYLNSHKIGTFHCSYCSKIFETMNKKKSHEHRTHELRKMYKCGYCDEMFKSFDAKRLHQMSEHNIKYPTFRCSACSKVFSKPSLLAIHIKKDHLMEKRFECTYCDKAFFFKFQLNAHTVSHTHVKDFKCEICDKSFGRMKTLREHVKIHADDRRFRCRHCDVAFVQKVSLKRHLQKKHDEVLDKVSTRTDCV